MIFLKIRNKIAILALSSVCALSVGCAAAEPTPPEPFAPSMAIPSTDYNYFSKTDQLMPRITHHVGEEEGKPLELIEIDGELYINFEAYNKELGFSTYYHEGSERYIVEKRGTVTQESATVFTLSPGLYIIGEDLKQGTYDIDVTSGMCSIYGDVQQLGGYFGEMFAAVDLGIDSRSTYANFWLMDGDYIYITDHFAEMKTMPYVSVKFTLK